MERKMTPLSYSSTILKILWEFVDDFNLFLSAEAEEEGQHLLYKDGVAYSGGISGGRFCQQEQLMTSCACGRHCWFVTPAASSIPFLLCHLSLRECLCAKSFQPWLTHCDAMDCSPPGSSVHCILQARILEWVAMSSSTTRIERVKYFASSSHTTLIQPRKLSRNFPACCFIDWWER